MGENVQDCNLKTTTGGYSGQRYEEGARTKGLCHVTFFKRPFPSLVLPLRKAKAVARSILHDFCFSGLSVMTFSICCFRFNFRAL